MITIYGQGIGQYRQGETVVYYQVDTGIVIAKEELEPVKRVFYDKVVGVDTKWLKDCVTEDNYRETLVAMDARVASRVSINHNYLCELLAEQHLTPTEAKTLIGLSRCICGKNYVVKNVRTLRGASGVNQKNFSRVLNVLVERGWVEIVRKDKPYRGDYVLRIHPVIAWKGANRDWAIQEWVKGKIAPKTDFVLNGEV